MTFLGTGIVINRRTAHTKIILRTHSENTTNNSNQEPEKEAKV